MRIQPPEGNSQWYLNNIVNDPGGTADLKSVSAETFERLLAAYREFEKENGVAPLPPSYSQGRQLLLKTISERLGSNILALALTLLVLLPFGFVAWRRRA